MGYNTDFYGRFTCTPPLSPDQVAYLQAFSGTRRMHRKSSVIFERPDPLREKVGLPIGASGQYYVGDIIDDSFSDSLDDPSIEDYNKPPKDQPSLWCQWIPTDDGQYIEWDQNEKFYCYKGWIQYIIDHFLKPWGIKLDGDVEYEGEDRCDRGMISIKDNNVAIKTASVSYI